MSRRTYQWLALGLMPLIAVLVVIGTAGAAPKGGLTVDLKVAQSDFRASQDVLVTVTLSNRGKQPVRILKWFTPADGVDESLFTVTRDGQPVAYTGAHVKRPAPTSGDYLQLDPGASTSNVVNLADLYDFSGTGRYEIYYNVASFGLYGASQSKDALASDTISLKAAGRAGKGNPPPVQPPGPGQTAFASCSAAQISALSAARTNASAYATNAVGYFTANKQGPRYTTWFGVFASSRYTTVTQHFGAISSAMTNAGITFDCKSKQKVYAFVYPNQPYTIYLGTVYWTAPAMGTDSQAGTLIHEMSHFDVVAGTDDVVYGQAGAKSLALSDPAKAITNADSHEYFAENNPSQN